MPQTAEQIAQEIQVKFSEIMAGGPSAFTLVKHQEFIDYLEQKKAQLNALDVPPYVMEFYQSLIRYIIEVLDDRKQKDLSKVLESNLKL